ncbi:AraC family transcriptional regulator [Streptomyces kaniharaensis]|uniref:AraC family transcriptional regulator n=1 Tax=Streptomyces kaniharaensis TaxID=212423 RepID=A0A6N7L4X1_9ACTN|nr:helix-turn-helix domain-containing protein [Streptomyces kaniharaensis]MQS17718.1 AraC family transcriptional regulator [Streptomyces kaniharaensis]
MTDQHTHGTTGMAFGTPAPPLRPYVLGYRGYRMLLLRPRRRLEVPTDVVTLALTFEGSMRLADAVDPARPAASFGSVAAGLRRTATIAEHAGLLHGLAVSLTPQGAYRVFGPLAGELGGQWAEPGDVLGPRLRSLSARLAETPTWPARFALLDDWFTVRIADGPAWEPSVAWTWHELRRTHGLAPVHTLVEGTGWSRRRLELRFRQHLGVAPKQAATILRLQRTLTALARQDGSHGGRPDAAGLAALCGYYDQSHLDRAFRAMVGCSPRAFLASRRIAAALPEPTDRVAGRVTSAVLSPGAPG